MRDAFDAQPETEPLAADAGPVDIRPEPDAQIALPGGGRASFQRVPMPPLKPEFLVNGTEPAGEGEEPASSGVLPDASRRDVGSTTPEPQPGTRLVSLPSPQLPLPPSMKDGQPPDPESDGEEESSSPGSFEKQVDAVELACVKPAVLEIVKRAGQFFRAVPIVTSGYRPRGRRGSLHRRCMAVDFVVPGISTQTLASYLRSQPDAGGVGTYCNTRSVHVDIGERRNWGYCGFQRTYFSLR